MTARTRDEIRDEILTDWSGRMTALGLALDTGEGSDPWITADALSVDLLRYEGQGEVAKGEIDPANASNDTLARLQALYEVVVGDGVKGAWVVTCTAPSSVTSASVGTRVLLDSEGRIYRPLASTIRFTLGSGSLAVEADVAGADYARDVGDVLRWDAAPLGVNPTATVASETTAPADAEGVEALRAQIVAYRRARPASGSPAHLVAICEAHEDCVEAYVYPCLGQHPSGIGSAGSYAAARLDKPGAFHVVVMGPPQGSTPVGASHARIPTAAQIAAVRSYLLGESDADGNATPGGSARFSSQLDPDDVNVSAPTPNQINVTATVYCDAANHPTGLGTVYTVSSSTTTAVVVALDASAFDDRDVLFRVSLSAARGGWVKRRVLSAVYDGVSSTTLTIDPLDPLPEAATVGSDNCRPAMGNWEAIRDAVFAWFDAMGPGDVPSAASVAPPAWMRRRRRWPPQSWRGPARLSPQVLEGVIAQADGVLYSNVSSPAAAVPFDPFELYVLGVLTIAVT